MTTKSVRLDNEAESALKDIMSNTGMSISDAIKQSLVSYREKAITDNAPHPSDFFKKYALGDGDYAIGPARDSKRLLKDKLGNKEKARSGRKSA